MKLLSDPPGATTNTSAARPALLPRRHLARGGKGVLNTLRLSFRVRNSWRLFITATCIGLLLTEAATMRPSVS
jgi:hypothetical protein